MAAAVTDKFIKGPANKSSTLSSSISDSVQTIPISDLTGVPTDTAVYAAIDAHDSSGTATPSTKEIVKGVVSGSNLINCTRGAEGTAQSHSAGAVVEFFFTAAANNDIVDGILVEHNQDGGHSDIDSDSITNDGTLTQTGVATFADHIDVTNAKSIRDGNDNELVTFSQTASAVNEITVKNAATGNGPEIQATGGDTNIDIELIPKGTGKVTVGGKVLVNPYCFRATLGTQMTNPTSGDIIQYNTEAYDHNSNFDTSTHKYTAPVDGVYHFNAGATTLADDARLRIQFETSGGAAIVGNESTKRGATVVTDINLSSGDTIWVNVLTGTASTDITNGNSTWFSGHLVHAT